MRFSALCDDIEAAVLAHEDVTEKLAVWNARAGTTYRPQDFTAYYGAVDTETFVRSALKGPARHLEDFSHEEAVGGVKAILSGLGESDNDFALALLECNLPGGGIVDLIYNPDAWFGLKCPPDLDAEQIVGCAMHRSGRRLIGSPPDAPVSVPLPGTPDHAARMVAEAWDAARAWAVARAERRFVDARRRRGDLESLLGRRPISKLQALLALNGAALTARMQELGLWPSA